MPFRIGQGVKPVRLATQNMRVIINELATVIGWGVTENGRLSNQLLQVQVPLVDSQICQAIWTSDPVTDRMLCAGVIGRDSCSGDSGGPIMYRGLQIGISSWGGNVCGSNYPSVYTKIMNPEIRSFIRRNID